MNWTYHEVEDFYVDPKGIRFNFHAYRQRKDEDGFTRDVKEYQAEKLDDNHQIIPAALTPKENVRKISVNPAWEYHKAKKKNYFRLQKTEKSTHKKRSMWKRSSDL